jgi:hypothetical protein
MLTVALFLASMPMQNTMWLLHTDDTMATIGVVDDRPVLLRLGSPNDGHRWCARSPVPFMDKVWLAGSETPTHWHFLRGRLSEGATKLTLVFQSGETELDSIWRGRKGRGPIEHWIEITNRSKSLLTIPQQESLALGTDPGGPAEVWWIRRGASNAMTQGGTFQEPVKAGMNLDLVSNHHDGASPVPWLSVQVGATRGLYVGWEFSGLGHLQARSDGHGVNIQAGLLPDFKTDVKPGETLTIPAAFVGCYKGDIDEGSQSLHRFVMEKLRANPPNSFQDPTTVCGVYLDAGGDKSTEATLLRSIDFAKGLGLDTYLVDAIWFPACGDWRWDPARFPRGSKPIGDAIRSAGMNFALWCAWDNGGVSSDPGALSVRGPAGHPDWFESNVLSNWQPGPFYGLSACMASDDARAWAIKKTQSLVSESHLQFLKTDCHPMVQQCVQTNHRHTHGTDVSYWSALGVYEVWDRLRAAFPNLVLENCSGASHIKDFGVVKRCAYTAVTDTLSNLPDRAGVYDSTFVLPPCSLMTYTYERGYNVLGDDPGSFLFRSGMMTAWDLAPTDSKNWTSEEKASARMALRSYKEWIRPVLQDCKVHHILPRPTGTRWDGMFFWSAKLGKGTAFVFRPNSVVGRQTIRLAGLYSRKRYLCWSEDGSIVPGLHAGSALMDQGFSVSLPERYTSDLIYIQESTLAKPLGWGEPAENLSDDAVSGNDYYGSWTDLVWRPGNGARSFRVTLSARSDLSEPFLQTIIHEPKISFKNVPPGRAAYWRVDSLGWGGTRIGAVRKFPWRKPVAWAGAFVSDLPWVKAEAGSGIVHRDVNYAAKPLSVSGKVFPKGVWTHAFQDGRPADVVVDIAGKGFGTFVSDAGVDDAAGGGSVQFQVLVDEKLVAESPVMRPGGIYHFRVDVAGAKMLTLRVLNGGDGYNSDHATWGLARLINKGAVDPIAAVDRG